MLNFRSYSSAGVSSAGLIWKPTISGIFWRVALSFPWGRCPHLHGPRWLSIKSTVRHWDGEGGAGMLIISAHIQCSVTWGWERKSYARCPCALRGSVITLEILLLKKEGRTDVGWTISSFCHGWPLWGSDIEGENLRMSWQRGKSFPGRGRACVRARRQESPATTFNDV